MYQHILSSSPSALRAIVNNLYSYFLFLISHLHFIISFCLCFWCISGNGLRKLSIRRSIMRHITIFFIWMNNYSVKLWFRPVCMPPQSIWDLTLFFFFWEGGSYSVVWFFFIFSWNTLFCCVNKLDSWTEKSQSTCFYLIRWAVITILVTHQ